jgi:hypothetical protein
VEPTNSSAIRFYRRLGWKTAEHDARIDRMIKLLRDPDGF